MICVADINHKNCIKNILNNGIFDKNPRPKYKDGSPAYSKFITHYVESYDISKNEFPIITLRYIPVKNAIKEIFWIYQDQTSDLNLLRNKYNIFWWDEWESLKYPNTIGIRYGETVKRYDLINKLIDGIKKDPYGRRHIINLWQEKDFEDSDGLNPCAFQTLFSVRGDFLDTMLVQRSSDFLVSSSINLIQYVALQMMISKTCNLKPGKFTRIINNVHIYERHINQALILLDRKIGKQPILKLNTNKTDFYSFTIDDFEIENYEYTSPQLKFELGI
ncbi:thymidylate synthase [Candidatus Arthromitus sp. SFB-rat-Yit]|uniref:thymidylate synthase n=1 Tax=Candidatus Arthromitus sp. SFB-rat-Yit TaxID=1041504 RepID=UPI000227A45D|nr:thymidylate synthase [Candidatus Arthromitus sp. SFB-rat-Yit]BAK80928.1 thymidylate synthase [Candidatus Arthromitus sp. SFB-rat-Yit]